MSWQAKVCVNSGVNIPARGFSNVLLVGWVMFSHALCQPHFFGFCQFCCIGPWALDWLEEDMRFSLPGRMFTAKDPNLQMAQGFRRTSCCRENSLSARWLHLGSTLCHAVNSTCNSWRLGKAVGLIVRKHPTDILLVHPMLRGPWSSGIWWSCRWTAIFASCCWGCVNHDALVFRYVCASVAKTNWQLLPAFVFQFSIVLGFPGRVFFPVCKLYYEDFFSLGFWLLHGWPCGFCIHVFSMVCFLFIDISNPILCFKQSMFLEWKVIKTFLPISTLQG